MTGWVLFAALYAICVLYVAVMHAAPYGDRDELIPYRWRWMSLAAPWLMLGDAWDNRRAAWRGIRRP